DHQGNLVVPVKFESLRNFSNQLAAARQNSKWGFIDNKGNTIVPFVYDIIYDFTENITAAYKNRRWSLIDRQGKKIRDLDVDVFYGFRNGSARFLQKGRYGRMNTKGEIVSFEKSGPDIYEYETNTRQASTQAAPCPDNIGFERGNFTNWECFVGEVDAVGTTNVITVTPSAPTPNRHVIYPAADPSEIDPYGLFPINPPDGSGYALKLGNNVNGAEAERVRYTITVPANAEEASITYRYAVVFQD
ncbi:MAG TPA: WG repeat-containing protein, partial [Chitinophagaceae bacterium]|nr:WG repeat-containing protein [Chitinophagaceae bacterium]